MLSKGPDPLGLLKAFRRRWKLAVGLGVVLAVVAGGLARVVLPHVLPRPKFEAKAVLLVAAQPPQVLFTTMDTKQQVDCSRYQKTQVAWIKSRVVLNAALQRPGIKQYKMVRERGDPVRWLQGNLDVNCVENSELLEISLQGESPDEVAGLVNAVKDAYLEEVVNIEHKRRQDRYGMLRKLKDQYVETLKSKRQGLKKLAEAVGSNDRETVALKQQFAIQHLATVEQELLEVQSQKRKAGAELALAEQMDQAASVPTVTMTAVNKAINDDPIVSQLQARLSESQARYAQTLDSMRRISRRADGDPALKKARDGVQAASRLLEARRKELEPIVTRQLQELARDTGTTHADGIRQQIAVLANLEGQLQAEIRKLSEGSHTLNVNTLDLQAIQDEIAQTQEAASKIGGEVEALNVELQAPPRVRELEDAVVPSATSDKQQKMMVGMATLAGFAMSLLGVSFWEFQARKVNSADEVVEGLGIPLIGVLPILPKPSRRRLSRQRKPDPYWQNVLIESIDAVRTTLLHTSHLDDPPRVVLITSALSGEGKTSLSCHLATSLARGGRKTLLMDGDLRRPAIDHLFDLSSAPGLSEVLRGEAILEESIQATPVPNLMVLPAGLCDEQAIQGLALGGIESMFTRLKEQFDFVIVDSSPILPVADGLLIARHADAVLFSILREVSQIPKIYAAYQRLAMIGVRVLGAVVIGADGGLYGNDYRHYCSRPRVRPRWRPSLMETHQRFFGSLWPSR